MFFPAVCLLFRILARVWHGIFTRIDPREIKLVLLTRFLSRLYELPLSIAVGLCEDSLSFEATHFSPFAKVGCKSVQTQVFMDVSLPLWKSKCWFLFE